MVDKKTLGEFSIPFEPDVVQYTYTKKVHYDDETKRQIDRRFLHSVESLDGKRACVIGAGTLGNEIVKNLAMSGVPDITVVDMDVFEPWNLPRSTLVRTDDVGKPKAEAVARRAAELSPFPITVRGICSDVTRLGYGFFQKFDVVISPGDSWSMRSFVCRGARLMGVPHISCGTSHLNHMGGMMTGLVTVEPPGCDACYECLAPGNIKDQEIKLSCTNHPRTVQPQVIPFSSTVAGFASQCAMHMLIGGFPYTRSGQSNKAWSYMINEMGYGDTEVTMRVLMSAPDPHCGFHRMLADSHDVKLVSIAIARDDDVRTIWRKISDVLGIDTQFNLDFVDDRLFYLAFPEGETGSEHRTPPIMSLMLDDRDTDDMDALTIARMPVDHVYYVRDACDIDGRRWPVRISFRRDAS